MGNLEEPLTVDTGTGKCGADATDCYQFRLPPSYADHLQDAGFQVMNSPTTTASTWVRPATPTPRPRSEAAGLQHTGAPGEITIVEVKGVKVAVLGFSSTAGATA